MLPLPYLPVNIDKFPALRAYPDKLLYIDKTEQIAALLSRMHRVSAMFLARPRRFGKTLLVSTLQSLFQGQRALFAGTWIGQADRWDWAGQQRPVLRLDMTVRNTHEPRHLEQRLQRLIARSAQRHDVPVELTEPPDMLTQLLQGIVTASGKKAVVLIDEYDTPINENMDRPEALPAILEVMRDFYGALKDNTDDIDFVFMTGIAHFARTGLFAGANQFRNLSFAPECGSLLGFTHSELTQNPDLAADIAQCARNLDCETDDLYEALQRYYDGYRFGAGAEAVYNPFSLANCLETLRVLPAARAWTLEHLPNAWADSGSPALLFRMLQGDRGLALQHLAAEPDIVTETTYDIAQPNLTTLMYHSGYLTYKQVWDPTRQVHVERLDLPNREVTLTFQRELLKWVRGQVQEWSNVYPDIANELRTALYMSLQRRDPQAFQQSLEAYLQTLPNTLHTAPAQVGPDILRYEFFYQSLVYSALVLIGVHVQAEVSTASGRIDIVCHLQDHVLILEIKTRATAETALKQALQRDYAAPWRHHDRPVVLMGLQFDTVLRTVASCRTWELGRFDMATGRWEHEPFAQPLTAIRRLSPADQTRLMQEPLGSWDSTAAPACRRSC